MNGSEHSGRDAIIADRYQVLRLLGEGGMGRVVAARNVLTGREVALKIARLSVLANGDNHARFLREARAASMLAHRHVIDVLDVVIAPDGAPVIVMELLRGQTLAGLLRARGSLTLAETAYCLAPILGALDHVHRAGLVHRDVKPANIFLAREADGALVPKLLDFGIAKVLLDNSFHAAPGRTSTGTMLGTPYYMAPEQVSGQSDVDKRADVWAAGAVVYECLTGRRPFTGDNFGQVFSAILLHTPPPLGESGGDVPVELADAVTAALTRDRAQRLDDVAPLRAALAAHVVTPTGAPDAPTPGIPDVVDQRDRGFAPAQQLAFAATVTPIDPSVGAPVGAPVGSRPDSRHAPPVSPDRDQVVEFCQAPDGVRIAYASVGQGLPLVVIPHWLSHLELSWRSPIWRPWLMEAARENRVIHHDQRGTGLSDWRVGDIGPDAWLRDLEAVVDAAGIGRFALFGLSQGAVTAVSYAARHPDRVSHLIVHGGFCQGWRRRGLGDDGLASAYDLLAFTRDGWGRDDPEYRERVVALYLPEGNDDDLDWFNRLQRATISADNAHRYMSAFGDLDIVADLAEVRAPTLVLHARNDSLIPIGEGAELAAGIRHSRFVELDSHNHILLAREPAWQTMWAEVRAFLSAAHGGEGATLER